MANAKAQSARIGTRLKAARERLGLTQDAFAKKLGIEKRQSLASIEAGTRRLTAQELLLAIQALGVDIDFFTDAFRLVGEGRFSFRAKPGVSAAILDQFEESAGRWIATYRELAAQQGEPPDWVGLKLDLDARSTFEQAHAAAESLVRRWELGEIPAAGIQDAIERHAGALVLNVDAPAGISGAASQVPGLNAVLVNRREPAARRNFDIAHEIFHLLTWEKMPPHRVEAMEVPRGGKGNRVELLAENFAAALLMPEESIREHWAATSGGGDLNERIRGSAQRFQVSGVACKWRLLNLGLLNKADLLDVDDRRLTAPASESALPLRFSMRFVNRIAAALDEGRLSSKRAAALLGLSLTELAALLRDYSYEPAFEA